MLIYVAIKLGEKEKAFLKDKVSTDSLIFRDELPKEERHQAFLNAQICFGNIRPGWLEETDQLEWIQLQSVGFGVYQKVKPKVLFQMTHLKNFFAVPVAETALAGILALYRGLDQMVRDKTDQTWQGARLRTTMHLLFKKHILILGGGAIGQHFKKIISGFDCEVTIYGRRESNSDIQTIIDLEKAISQTDILVNILPGTKATTHLLNEERLSQLKPTSIFVNVGRGSAVDEPALIRMLNEERIAGAVLDVTYEEPLPKDHPLWQCPNTLITQHTAGGYEEEILDIVKVFLKNLSRFRNNEPLEHVVDLERGY